jgi:dTDP-glucose pyrophosphorylase
LITDWQKTIILNTDSIQDALESLNRSSLQIVLVTDEKGNFIGTITDGDIRRGVLKGLSIKDSVDSILNRSPLVVPPEMSKESVIHLMRANKIKQLPIIESGKKVTGLHVYDELDETQARQNYFVVMVGGKGIRMRPFTENCPKPMLLIKDKPMLEHIMNRAILDGFSNFIFCIHYLGKMIQDYFEDGKKWNVSITYIEEEEPLGTAGALSLIPYLVDLPIIVTNGDVLTDIHYSDLLNYSELHSASGIMAVREYVLQHPFGVVNTQGINIESFEEKPNFKTLVNAGIYCLRPEALGLIPRNKYLDMPTLFSEIRANGKKAVVYPMHETWMDVGRPNDLEFAKQKYS